MVGVNHPARGFSVYIGKDEAVSASTFARPSARTLQERGIKRMDVTSTCLIWSLKH